MNNKNDPDFFRNFLAFILIGAFITVVPLFIFKTIPAGNKDIITYMIGQLSGMATTALGFYFVTKAGQDALDAKRADNTGKLADAITATAQVSTTASDAAQATADAATEKADEIKGKKP